MWNINFLIKAQDWEVGAVKEFFNLLYSIRLSAGGMDKILWSPSKKGKCTICSFCEVFTTQGAFTFLGEAYGEVRHTKSCFA